MAESQSPSNRLVAQRIRNRIIEVLELVADSEAQRKYDLTYSAGDAVFIWWEEWFDPEDLDYYAPPLYTLEERQALIDFHKVWERACEQTPARLPAIEQVQEWPIWQELTQAGDAALAVFKERGTFPEDVEETLPGPLSSTPE